MWFQDLVSLALPDLSTVMSQPWKKVWLHQFQFWYRGNSHSGLFACLLQLWCPCKIVLGETWLACGRWDTITPTDCLTWLCLNVQVKHPNSNVKSTLKKHHSKAKYLTDALQFVRFYLTLIKVKVKQYMRSTTNLCQSQQGCTVPSVQEVSSDRKNNTAVSSHNLAATGPVGRAAQCLHVSRGPNRPLQ